LRDESLDRPATNQAHDPPDTPEAYREFFRGISARTPHDNRARWVTLLKVILALIFITGILGTTWFYTVGVDDSAATARVREPSSLEDSLPPVDRN
jgi:hypothetical protein